MKKKIIVVGGGAAGLMAAGRAAERGHEVHLYEKNNPPFFVKWPGAVRVLMVV